MLKKRNNLWFFLASVIPLLLLVLRILSCPAIAQDANVLSEPDYKVLARSIQNTIISENENLQNLRNQLGQLKDTNQSISAEINAYQVQISTHGNLLLLPGTDIRNLEKARSDNHIALENVRPRIKSLKQRLASIRTDREQTEAQIRLNKNQLESLKTVNTGRQEIREAISLLIQLMDVLTAKQDSLYDIHSLYGNFIDQFEEILSELGNLSIEFEKKIAWREKQFLLSRTHSLLAIMNKSEFLNELQTIKAGIKRLWLKETWQKGLRTDWKSGQSLLISFFLIFCIFQFLLMRLNRRLKKYIDPERTNETVYQQIALRIMSRSLYLFGATAFGYIYSSLAGLYDNLPIIRIAILVLAVFLFTKWGHDFLKFWLESSTWLTKRPVRLLFNLIGFIRYFSIAYLLIGWILESDAVLLIFARLVLEVFLLIWLFTFWSAYNKHLQPPEGKPSRLASFLSSPSYGVVVIGIVMEILGYGGLSAYWYTSCGLSLIVTLWFSLVFLILRRWRQILKAQINEQKEEHPTPVFLFRWAMLQMGWIVGLITSAIFIVIAWGGKKTLIFNLLNSLTKEVAIGSINISLMNLLYALLILILTQTLTRFWQYFLKEKILSGSGMNVGLQNSITMISVYSFWAFGILLSLHVFGFGTTSLAVGFGALGIGLGFGLQNIFNNFISGIIMLIERPIMVGDDVEINETWATVKKINVRSTVVQTYDNATLIIPNSEFVSQQVKNWSFKDKRLRVKIDVGVAYGSDIELVRETLLEIARETPKVFKSPAPDIIFRDFGDSALIFRLRVWTDIDNMFKVETAIRFEIDRLFKERNIVIAFPQRDVHLFHE